MSGGYRWQRVERDPGQEGSGYELRLVPYLSPALDGDEAGGEGGGSNFGTGVDLHSGKMTWSRRWWEFDWENVRTAAPEPNEDP